MALLQRHTEPGRNGLHLGTTAAKAGRFGRLYLEKKTQLYKGLLIINNLCKRKTEVGRVLKGFMSVKTNRSADVTVRAQVSE